MSHYLKRTSAWLTINFDRGVIIYLTCDRINISDDNPKRLELNFHKIANSKSSNPSNEFLDLKELEGKYQRIKNISFSEEKYLTKNLKRKAKNKEIVKVVFLGFSVFELEMRISFKSEESFILENITPQN
ncbi:hypothetical protein [Carboxylicivirga caseinilyticus]|uniref:hypothetical protein n=1 Tax=Carboxylicivirga caseinilyticus TaxID=3417572 RepID=UPI003D34E636|nr:hypothetical protein [Marinilabiliaceae bacterium A049]